MRRSTMLLCLALTTLASCAPIRQDQTTQDEAATSWCSPRPGLVEVRVKDGKIDVCPEPGRIVNANAAIRWMLANDEVTSAYVFGDDGITLEDPTPVPPPGMPRLCNKRPNPQVAFNLKPQGQCTTTAHGQGVVCTKRAQLQSHDCFKYTVRLQLVPVSGAPSAPPLPPKDPWIMYED